MDKFKLIIVEDVPLELKGTEGIVRNEIPEAEVIGTADDELSFWRLIKKQQPDLVLLDLGRRRRDMSPDQVDVPAGEGAHLHWRNT